MRTRRAVGIAVVFGDGIGEHDWAERSTRFELAPLHILESSYSQVFARTCLKSALAGLWP